jgi:hypothetical protein
MKCHSWQLQTCAYVLKNRRPLLAFELLVVFPQGGSKDILSMRLALLFLAIQHYFHLGAIVM